MGRNRGLLLEWRRIRDLIEAFKIVRLMVPIKEKPPRGKSPEQAVVKGAD